MPHKQTTFTLELILLRILNIQRMVNVKIEGQKIMQFFQNNRSPYTVHEI